MSVIVDFIAGEDLTAARGLVLYSNSSEKVQKAGAAANATVVGICVQGAASVAGGTIEPHDYVTANASGKVVVASAQNDYIIGRYMPNLESGTQRDAAANDEIRILVFENPRVLVP
jgi:regulator of RNase E activity RraA